MKLLTRFGIFMKRTLRQPVFWLIAALSLALQAFLGRVALPSGDNMRIGLYQENGILAEAIAESLLSGSSRYEFIRYDTAESLEEAVRSGYADSGFILDERLDGIASSGSMKECVDCLNTTSSTKTAAAKEEIFSSVLYHAGGDILEELVRARDSAAGGTPEDAAADSTPEDAAAGAGSDEGSAESSDPAGRAQEARRRYEELVDSDQVLRVIFLDENGHAPEEAGDPDAASKEAGQKAHRRGIWTASLILFAAALFFAGERFRTGPRAVAEGLRITERPLFHFLRNLPPVLLLGLIQPLLFSGHEAGIRFIPVWLLYLLLTAAWATLFSLLFRKETVYIFSVLICVLLAGILTSELVYLPSLNILMRIFPPGMLRGLL